MDLKSRLALRCLLAVMNARPFSSPISWMVQMFG